VRVEWVTLCREVEESEHGRTVNLLGVELTGFVLNEPPPVAVTAIVALCLAGDRQEVKAVLLEEGDPFDEAMERRQVTWLEAVFAADEEGVYALSVGISGEGVVPVRVPFIVRRFPEA